MKGENLKILVAWIADGSGFSATVYTGRWTDETLIHDRKTFVCTNIYALNEPEGKDLYEEFGEVSIVLDEAEHYRGLFFERLPELKVVISEHCNRKYGIASANNHIVLFNDLLDFPFTLTKYGAIELSKMWDRPNFGKEDPTSDENEERSPYTSNQEERWAALDPIFDACHF
jgi:hypothetical protein